MSYCVNCGVELDKSQKCCPLCNTPVINPNESTEITTIPPYPIEDVSTVVRKIRRVTALFISLLIILALIICPLCDYIIFSKITWSRFAILSVIFAWICVVPPILLKHNILLKCSVIDYLSSIIYLYFMNMMTTPEVNWYFNISFPILSYIMAIILIYLILIKNFNISIPVYISIGFLCLAVLSVMIDYILVINNDMLIGVMWSIPVLAACMGVAVLIIIISQMAKLYSVKKRMHI